MKTYFFIRSRFACSREKLFGFHEDPIGFEVLVGLDPGVSVLQKPVNILKGAEAVLKVDIFPGISKEWVSRHTDYKKNEVFEDTQIRGPFKKFIHQHLFFEDGENSILEDRIEFEFFLLGISKYFIYMKLKSQFTKRHKATADHLGVHSELLSVGLIHS